MILPAQCILACRGSKWTSEWEQKSISVTSGIFTHNLGFTGFAVNGTKKKKYSVSISLQIQIATRDNCLQSLGLPYLPQLKILRETKHTARPSHK